MKAGTLFSGIGAPEVSCPGIDWRWQAEIDPFACAVLAHHFPHVVNLGDVSRIDTDAIEPVDLIVFGSPCQSFSVAGKRLGLDDPRGNMALVGLRVVGRVRPRWVVWENVPGVLSSDGGRDFGAFLGLLGELGYGFAYRVLDAQHFGVPQRRRRVFVVGCLGDWRPAAAVLFEPESLRGDSPPRRETGQGVAPTIAPGAHPGGVANAGVMPAICFDARQSDVLQYGDKTGPLDTCGFTHGIAHSLRADGFDAGEDETGRGTPLVCGTIGAENVRYTTGMESGADLLVPQAMSVRRLTPRECERLQGLPDNWTAITYRGKPAADGPRYRAIGNSMAVPVIGWILNRIGLVDAMPDVAEAAD